MSTPFVETPESSLLQGLPPVASRDTRLLVLGSFPSAASLSSGQYYAHPRNQFWPLLSAIWSVDLRALPYAERLAEVLRRGLGIWDVYARCRREGSLDTAIRDAQFNDLAALRRDIPGLRGVAHNGSESARAQRFTRGFGLPVTVLPSTSPAHAAWSFERKLDAWREAFENHGIA